MTEGKRASFVKGNAIPGWVFTAAVDPDWSPGRRMGAAACGVGHLRVVHVAFRKDHAESKTCLAPCFVKQTRPGCARQSEERGESPGPAVVVVFLHPNRGCARRAFLRCCRSRFLGDGFRPAARRGTPASVAAAAQVGSVIDRIGWLVGWADPPAGSSVTASFVAAPGPENNRAEVRPGAGSKVPADRGPAGPTNQI
jgi:hypothetical protein